MAYVPTYTADDLSAVAIDFIVGVAAVLVGFAGIIGLVMLYKWLTGKKVKFLG